MPKEVEALSAVEYYDGQRADSVVQMSVALYSQFGSGGDCSRRNMDEQPIAFADKR